jgi:hypothetical protein
MLSRRCLDKRHVGYCSVCLALVSYIYGCAIHNVKRDNLLIELPKRSSGFDTAQAISNDHDLHSDDEELSDMSPSRTGRREMG